MKKIHTFLALVLFSLPSVGQIISLEVPVELEKMKVEYYESSQQGQVTLIGCHKCEKTRYPFKASVQIERDGQNISLDELLKDYWNASFPTVFLNLDKTEIVRIIY